MTIRPNGTCRACGRATVTARTGRQHVELDPDPDPSSPHALAVSIDSTQTVRARPMTEDNPSPDPWERMLPPHWVTCPATPRAVTRVANEPPPTHAALAEVLPFRRPDPASSYRGRA